MRAGLWRFAGVELHDADSRLRVGDRDQVLDRSSHGILRYLLERAGEVVTKDELLEAGWPGRVVSENSLAKAVSRLRVALGEQGGAIRAVHGYGYRLVAAVDFRALAEGGPADSPGETECLREGDPLPLRPGWRIGRRLGEGSTGVIHLAQTEQGQTRAVKVATGESGLRGLKREIALTRYIREVKPDLGYVAQVLDWNLSQPPFFLELPYFADGHLGQWAGTRGGLATLDLQARIGLCVRLCEAVAGLHEIGVIHKDLKPENLYPVCDGDGQWHIVLADLGAGEAVSSLTLALTMSIAADVTSPRAGSLLYLAPEVIAGEAPTQRSDVFALGVLLYQLVVGDLRRSLAPGWEADVDDELLREDIALAAASNPQRRDIDARSLAQRLHTLGARREQLEHERGHALAVEQQARQLAAMKHKRRWLLAGMGVLTAFLVLSLWQQYRVQNARDAAEAASRAAHENAAIADAVNRFFNQDVLGAASPYAQTGKQEPTIREAVDQAVARIDERLRNQPVVEASVRMTIGQVYGEMMQIAKAIEQERRAVALFERHLGPADPRTQQARYRLASDLTDDSRFDEAKRIIDETDAWRSKAGEADVETTLHSHRTSCYWHIRREQYAAGQSACEGAIASQLALDASDRNAVIKARANLAVLHSRDGRFAQAEEQFDEIEKDFRVLGDHDSPTRLRFSYLHGMNLVELARYEEAAQALSAAYRGSVAALGPDNPHTLEVQMGLARLHALRAQHAQAVPLLQHAYSAYARQFGEESHYTRDARNALRAAMCATNGRRASGKGGEGASGCS